MRTDLNRIGLGTVQLGLPYGIANKTGRPDMGEAKAILNYASDHGIDLLDTAAGYGESEKVLGNCEVKSFRIVSKWRQDPEEELRQSIAKLKVDSLYGWMAHRPTELLTNQDNWKVMQSLQDRGLVKKIGVSVYDPDELNRLLDHGIEPSIIQFPFNALDQRFAGLLKPLKEMGCELHCRSVYLQGLFFMDPAGLSDFFDPVREWLKEVKNVAPDKKTLMGALIASVLAFEEIDKLIIGVEHHTQLMELVDVLSEERVVKLPATWELNENILNPSKWPKKN